MQKTWILVSLWPFWGENIDMISFWWWQGFVERKTTLIGSLTVREFLYHSALLELPGFFCQKKSVVEDAILAMSLGDYANKLIGGHCYMKGLPSGERRRVSIARELVMRPQILFIDEPLYHLDRCFSQQFQFSVSTIWCYVVWFLQCWIVITNVLASLTKSVFNLFNVLSNELADPWLIKKSIWFSLQKHISREVPCVVHQAINIILTFLTPFSNSRRCLYDWKKLKICSFLESFFS